MKQKDRYAEEEFVRFLKWVKRNPEFGNMICGHDKDDMTIDGFRTVMLRLQKESLFIPMYVFLTVYHDVSYVRAAKEAMFLELFTNEWRTNGNDVFREFYQVLV